MRGFDYRSPLATTRDYLAEMAAVTHASPAPAEPPPIVLAALRPRMLELARDAADGAHPYFVPVEHTRRAREILGDGKLLAPELAVVLEPDADKARRLARQHTGGFYLSAPNYVRNLEWLGFSPADLEGDGSMRSSTPWWRGATRRRSSPASRSTWRPAPITCACNQ